jgi:hypothetical protein
MANIRATEASKIFFMANPFPFLEFIAGIIRPRRGFCPAGKARF